MEEAHVIQGAEESEEKERGAFKKVLIAAGVTIFLLLIGGISYFVGRQSKETQTEAISPSPTEEVSPTATLTPTPQSDSESPTKTPTPTKKPTSTPTPTPTPTPVIKTMTISSEASLDGFRSSNGGGNAGLDIRAGRNVNLVTRGFVSFNISGIPSGSTITEATLRLYQAKIIGNPYGAGGSLNVDHLDYGGSLENADYALASLLSNFATLTNNASIEWKDVNVTDRLKNDISGGRSKSQYRTHFTTEVVGGDVTGDFTYFESADNSEGTGNLPQLIIKYY